MSKKVATKSQKPERYADIPCQQKRIEKQTIQIILNEPFFSSLLLKMPVVENNYLPMPTMCTDGVRIYYDRKFVHGLTDEELQGVLIHEVYHPAWGHLWRLDGRDMRLWNIATDHVVNLALLEYAEERRQQTSGRRTFALPSGLYADPRFKDMCAEEVYAILVAEKESQPEQKIKIMVSIGDFMEPGSGEGDGDKDGDGNNGQTIEVTVSEHEWKMAVAQAYQAAKMQGHGSPALDRLFNRIVEPAVDWPQVLERFCRSITDNETSWRVRDRRFDQILPGMYSEEVGDIVVAVDTSGSITDELLQMFISQIQHIMDSVRPRSVKVIYIDDRIHGAAEEYRPGDSLAITKPKGFGGTDFRPLFEHIDGWAEPPECIVYLTDGYGSFPDQEYHIPTMWCVIPGGVDRVPWGEYIKMK